MEETGAFAGEGQQVEGGIEAYLKLGRWKLNATNIRRVRVNGIKLAEYASVIILVYAPYYVVFIV